MTTTEINRDELPPQAAILCAAFLRCVAIAQPLQCLAPALPPPPRGRTLVIGAGKASAAMAAALEALWAGPLAGLVLTRHGHAMPTRSIEIIEAGHPVPDESGYRATRRLCQLMGEASPDDLIIGLFSGGGSSLLCAPAGKMTLADKQALNRALLASGAPIHAMNTIRKHLSDVKGGRLALMAPRTPIVSLIISDVPGDDLSTIASGPTVGDATTLAQADRFIRDYGIALPPAAHAALARPDAETPKPGDAALAHVDNRLVMTPDRALQGARVELENAGYLVEYLGDDLQGEARALGAAHARLARARSLEGRRLCILSGGETTVTLRASGGRGGRNAEYLLGLALELDGAADIWAIAADTDGIDGSEDNAGAWLDPQTLSRARHAGVDPAQALAANNAYRVFEAAGGLVKTGPTHTNVNDFRAILIAPT